MTVTATDLLLEATDISKTYGAVVALRSASLRVRPGEVHALMGANGAGKSTLVKILTGAVRPDTGAIAVRGRERIVHSPGEARRGGLVSVYQEPALIPDLDIRSNLRLTNTPVEPFRHWLAELGLESLDLSSMARRVPLASLRIIDLARALAIDNTLPEAHSVLGLVALRYDWDDQEAQQQLHDPWPTGGAVMPARAAAIPTTPSYIIRPSRAARKNHTDMVRAV